MTERIRDLEKAASQLPPVFLSESERRAFFIDLVQKLIDKFRDLSTTREIPDPSSAHLAVAAKNFEFAKDFSVNLRKEIPNFLSDDYREKLQNLVHLTRGGALSNFLSHPVFAACVKEGFVKPLSMLSGELIDSSQEYIELVFCSLLEVDAPDLLPLQPDRISPMPQVCEASIPLRHLIMLETLEFLEDRQAECRAHMEVRDAFT